MCKNYEDKCILDLRLNNVKLRNKKMYQALINILIYTYTHTNVINLL